MFCFEFYCFGYKRFLKKINQAVGACDFCCVMSSASFAKAHVVSRSVAAKNVLSADELELFELASLAGVTMHPKVFK